MDDEEVPYLICSAVVYFPKRSAGGDRLVNGRLPAMQMISKATIEQDNAARRQHEFDHFWSEALADFNRWREGHPLLDDTQLSIRVALSGPEAARGIGISAEMLRAAVALGAELMID